MPTDAAAREKWRAYPNTVLTFAGPPELRVDLRQPVGADVRRALAEAGWSNPFAVFTAENPSGDHEADASSSREEAARDRDNARRRATLRDELRRRRVRVREVSATAPDGEYPESCLAIDASLEEAVRIAREWEQLALFWFDGTSFWLVPAAIGERPIALPGAAGVG